MWKKLLCVGICICCGGTVRGADDISSPKTNLATMYSFPITSPDKTTIIRRYCWGMLSTTPSEGQLVWNLGSSSFSSRNALFVRALCHAWNPEPLTESLVDKVFQKDFVKKLSLQQYQDKDDVCIVGAKQYLCDISRYSFAIFRALMSDIFKIKWAHAVFVDADSKFQEKNKRIANIFKTYFLLNESDESVYQKKFPKTSAMIDNQQKQFRKYLQSLTMLDNEALLKASAFCTSETPIGNGAQWCGLHMSGDKGMNEHFLFLLANEYLNYRIFIDYYTHQLRKGITSSYPDDGEKQAPYLNELQSLAFQRELFESSLQTALKDFQDFVTTYPLHIGLVVYQERLLQFRDTIVKVVPYFYNLYEKLRNVQNAKN